MTRYIALLRAVNVGGTGQLPMADLKKLCADAGLSRTARNPGTVAALAAMAAK